MRFARGFFFIASMLFLPSTSPAAPQARAQYFPQPPPSQSDDHSDQRAAPSLTDLLRAYRLAFHLYAKEDGPAPHATLSSGTSPDTLRAHFNMNEKEFEPFRNAALEYGWSR